MRRLRGDRGAVAVMVALMMIPVLVCAALVVDVGALYFRRSQLQNAADAAALAIAQDCAGPTGCGDPPNTASIYIGGNTHAGAPDLPPVIALPASGMAFVTVTAKSRVDYLFAPVIDDGVKSGVVTATGSARWTAISGGTAILPIALPMCTFLAQTPTGGPPISTVSQRIFPRKGIKDCPGYAALSGGFGWLVPDGTDGCSTRSNIDGKMRSDPGNANHSVHCIVAQATNPNPVLIPVYDTFSSDDATTGNGANGTYHIVAYAAFQIDGYFFGNNYSLPAHPKGPCKEPESCISGYFTKFVAPSEVFTVDSLAPDKGARVVNMCVPGLGGNCS